MSTVKVSPVSRRRKHIPKSALGAGVGVNGLLLVGVFYTVFPLLWLVGASTKSLSGLYSSSPVSWSEMHLWENIIDVVTQSDGIFVRWLINSIAYAGVGAIVGGLICTLAGYAFDKFDFGHKESWYASVLIGVLVPTTATAIPLYLLASSVGLVNTVWAVMIPFLANPFGVYLARIFSAGYVPGAVIEAARVDGATELQAFSKIALPMMGPGYVTIVLFQFVGIWNNFMLPLMMLSNQRLYPVSLGLYNWNAQTSNLPSLLPMVVTGSLLSLIPLLLAFIFLQRFWRSGLAAGGVKA